MWKFEDELETGLRGQWDAKNSGNRSIREDRDVEMELSKASPPPATQPPPRTGAWAGRVQTQLHLILAVPLSHSLLSFLYVTGLVMPVATTSQECCEASWH